MNINSILFDLKEKYETSKGLPKVVFEASASNKYGKYAYVTGSFSYAESLGGYKLLMCFWGPCINTFEEAYTGRIDDEVRFIKACIGLINDVLKQYPSMNDVVLDHITRF